MVEITIPPLRDRSDFAAILDHTLSSVAPAWRIDANAVARLAERPWRGNVRELRATLARLTLGAASGVIDVAMLAQLPSEACDVEEPARTGGLRESMRARIWSVHKESRGNISETARRLHVSRNTIYRALAEEGRPTSAT
jgi:transcriptional regulator of acetoin/glycerol metabolism